MHPLGKEKKTRSPEKIGSVGMKGGMRVRMKGISRGEVEKGREEENMKEQEGRDGRGQTGRARNKTS